MRRNRPWVDQRNHGRRLTLIRNALFPAIVRFLCPGAVLIQGTRQLLKHPSKTNPAKASQRLVDVALNCSKFALKRMSLAEILEELPKLTEEERDELRSRLDEYDAGFLSILQERVRGIQSGERETIPADQVIAEGRRLAQELAQQ
jgi:hypothetical protein